MITFHQLILFREKTVSCNASFFLPKICMKNLNPHINKFKYHLVGGSALGEGKEVIELEKEVLEVETNQDLSASQGGVVGKI